MRDLRYSYRPKLHIVTHSSLLRARNNATTGWKDKQEAGPAGVVFDSPSLRTIMCIRRAEEDEIPRLTTCRIDEMEGRARAGAGGRGSEFENKRFGKRRVGMNERTTASHT